MSQWRISLTVDADDLAAADVLRVELVDALTAEQVTVLSSECAAQTAIYTVTGVDIATSKVFTERVEAASANAAQAAIESASMIVTNARSTVG